MRPECPICNKLLVQPAGFSKNGILIVGEYPGQEEIIQGVPFVGMAGEILKAEFRMAGVPYEQCRVTNLWRHQPPEKDDENKSYFDQLLEEEFNLHLGWLIEEMKNARFLFLMGSECARVFAPDNVLNLTGLEIESAVVPDNIERIMVAVNPALAIHSTHGEFRLAAQRFQQMIQEVL